MVLNHHPIVRSAQIFRARVRVYISEVICLAVLLSAGFVFAADLKTKYAELETLKTKHTAATADQLAQKALLEKDLNFRLAVLDQLAVLGFNRIIPTITPLLKDKNVPVRQRTARVIGMLGGSGAEKALLNALPKETNTDVKAAILQGLSLCGSEQSVQAIQATMADSHREVRANAVGALQRIPGDRSKSALEEARNDQDKQIRKLADDAVNKRSKK